MQLNRGERIGFYEIVKPIGSGGMGEVYQAIDLRLGRQLALKALPAHTAADPEKLERFQQEARVVASLNHPHIVTLYSVEESNGLHFLTMELVEGKTLDQLIPSSGLPMREFFDYSIAMIDSLVAAHERGIVHRDLKPANIMVNSDGRIKVLDFGLAKLLMDQAVPESSMMETRANTREGIVMGTFPYMSPEQIQGKPLGTSSDIFSFGIILYEMLCGKRPFHGDTSAELISSILRDTPPAISILRAEVPGSVSRIVEHCLQKKEKDRYPSARDVWRDLKDARRAYESSSISGRMISVSKEQPRSIAVLPFMNLSGAEEEYFSDGVAEEIINALTQIQELRVAARTSSFSFKGKNEDLRVIGGKLNVETVLEGSIRRAGNRLRIMVQLINVADGYHVWSERFDREMTDVFAVQDEIASSIAAKLKATIGGTSAHEIAGPGTSIVEAYELYLQGRALLRKRGESILQALEKFQKAADLDPNFAKAYAGAADTYRLISIYGLRPPAQFLELAKVASERALAIDPELAEAYDPLAHVAIGKRDYEEARRCWEKSIALNPMNPSPRAEFALWYWAMIKGDFEEALKRVRYCVNLDPLSPWCAGIQAMILANAGKRKEAVEESERGLALDPTGFVPRWAVIEAYSWAGEHERTVAAAEEGFRIFGRHIWFLAPLGLSYARAGRHDEVEKIYQEVKARSEKSYVQPFWIASLAAEVGLQEEALNLAMKAAVESDAFAITAKYFPDWERLRTLPGFDQILRKLHF